MKSSYEADKEAIEKLYNKIRRKYEWNIFGNAFLSEIDKETKELEKLEPSGLQLCEHLSTKSTRVFQEMNVFHGKFESGEGCYWVRSSCGRISFLKQEKELGPNSIREKLHNIEKAKGFYKKNKVENRIVEYIPHQNMGL